MSVKKVLIIGAGQIGSGIAQCTAFSGIKTVIYDKNEAAIAKALQQVDKNLSRLVSKGKISNNEKTGALLNISESNELNLETCHVDMIIEASAKSLNAKHELFKTLDHLCPSNCILASNSSYLPITALACKTRRPERVVGLHFFTPVPIIKMVEIVRSFETSDNTYATVKTFCQTIGKTPAEVEDSVGLIGNRLLMPYINEAIFSYMEGVASSEDIDNVARKGFNHPMGPLELADLIGLDTVLEVMEQLYDGFNDSKYRPCPLLKRMVAGGWLGRKSGKGFYSYEKS